MKQAVRCLASSLMLLSLATAKPSYAQIVPDTTLPTNSRIAPGCTACIIEDGTARGTNLFHSFQQFSIPTGGSAWFNNNLQIQNIFTRVTGPFPSNIDGLIRANGSANLFFLNPNGILFGPNARLQLGGSFFATTANSFKFPDGSEFSAVNPQAPPLLTINVPIGLQYGPSHSGSTITNRGKLTVEQDLTLAGDRLDLQGQLQAGGNLTLQAQDIVQIRDSATNPFIAQSGSRLLVQGDQGVDIFALSHPDSGLFSDGDMVLRSANDIRGDAHYAAGRNFQIEQLDGSPGNLTSPHDPIIRASGDVSLASYTGASLHIFAGGTVFIRDTVFITGSGTSANSIVETVRLSDGTLLEIDGATYPTLDIRAGTTALGSPFVNTGDPTGGNIEIGAIVFNPIFGEGGRVFLTNQYQPNLSLSPGNIAINSISTSDIFGGGSVVADSRGGITLNGTVNVSSLLLGTSFLGNGGDVIFLARHDIALLANPAIFSAGLLGGKTILTSDANVLLTNSGILSESSGAGRGGDISIQAKLVEIADGTRLQSNSYGLGRSGDISIRADSFFLTNGSQVGTIASDNGQGGNLIINASKTMQLSGISAGGDLSALFTEAEGNSNGGNLIIETGQLVIQDGAQVAASTFGNGQSGNLSIKAGESVKIIGTSPDGGAPSGLFVQTEGTGNAQSLTIETKQLLVQGGALISTTTFGSGQSGNLTVKASESVQLTGTSPGADPSGLFAQTQGAGNGGNLTIETRQLLVQDGAQVSAGTAIQSQGRGGNLTVKALDSVQLVGTSADGLTASGLFAQTQGTGDAQNLAIETKQLLVQGGAQVSVTTFGSGQSGSLNVKASETVQLLGTSADGETPSGLFARTEGAGNAGNLVVETNQLWVQGGARVETSTQGRGKGGTIQITARDSIELAGVSLEGRFSSGLFTTSDSQVSGEAGSIKVTTSNLQLTEGAVVSARTRSISRGGDIQIDTNTLEVVGGAQLLTTASNRGRAGDITVNASKNILLSGSDPIFPDRLSRFGSTVTDAVDSASGLFANTTSRSTGQGGNLTVLTPQLTIQNGAKINVNSQGSGIAGNINVTADSISLNNQGVISAETFSQDGGNITLQVQDLLLLRRNSLISTTAGTAQAGGNGGNITINAPKGFIVGVLSENSDIRANAFTGKGGNVNITAQGIYGLQFQRKDTPFSDITASSQFGVSGTVRLNILNLDPSRSLVQLPLELADPSSLISQECTPTSKSANSSFVVTGSGGLPANPTGILSGEVGTTRLVDVEEEARGGDRETDRWGNGEVRDVGEDREARTSQSKIQNPKSKIPSPIVEAQGWIIQPDGTVVLVADPANVGSVTVGRSLPPCPSHR